MDGWIIIDVYEMKRLGAVLALILAIYVPDIFGSLIFAVNFEGRGFMASTSSYPSGGVMRRDDIDWIKSIGTQTLVGFHGDVTDCDSLYDDIYASNKMHEMNFGGRSLSCDEIASICRSFISQKLRSKAPMQIDLIVMGWDKHLSRPRIFCLDRIGSMKEVEYIAHGKIFLL